MRTTRAAAAAAAAAATAAGASSSRDASLGAGNSRQPAEPRHPSSASTLLRNHAKKPKTVVDHVEAVSTKPSKRRRRSSPSSPMPSPALRAASDNGSMQTDPSGKPLRTIANMGLPRGARASCGEQGLLAPIAIRVLMDVHPLLSHQTITQAMDILAKGGDLQRAKNLLKHDDVTTVRALIRHWHEVWDMDVPALYRGEDVSALSAQALQRSSRRFDTAIHVPLMVEEAGIIEADGAPAPLLPEEMVGRRFANGDELKATVRESLLEHQQRRGEGQKKLPAAATAALSAAGTFAMQVELDAAWVALPALETMLEACDIRPLATLVIETLSSGGNRAMEAQLRKYPHAAEEDEARGGRRLYRLVTGRWAALPKTATSPASAATVLLSAPASLVQPEPTVREAARRTAALPLADGAAVPPPCLLAVPSKEARQLLAPASLLQKALRRGNALSGSQAPLLEAAEALLASESCTVSELGYQRCSGTRMLLWRVFASAIEDSCPFKDPPKGGPVGRGAANAAPLSVTAILALALVAHADGGFRLPGWLAQQVVETALSLQAHDNAGAQWPWRGWRRYEKAATEGLSTPEFGAGEVPRLRDALRCALLVGPLTSGEALVAKRLLGAALEASESLEQRLAPLPLATAGHAPTSSAQGPKAPLLDAQLTLAALDQDVFPNMLLLIQACMPLPPTDPGQHSLRALSDLVGRLSSGVNCRTLLQQAGGGPAQELFRIQQFTEGQGGDPFLGLAEDTPGEGPGWTSVEDALKLTPHEVELLRVIHSVQSHLADQLAGTWQASARALMPPAPKNPAAAKPKSDTSASISARGEVHIKLEPSGRDPTPHEARTAFLQLLGAREVLPVKWTDKQGRTRDSTVAVTIAGTPADPFLVQRVGDANSDESEEEAGGATGTGSVPHMYRYLGSGALKDAAVSALITKMEGGVEVALPSPPPGFLWAWPCMSSATAVVRVTRGVAVENSAQAPTAKNTRSGRGRIARRRDKDPESGETRASQAESGFCFYVNDILLRPFDATGVLVACNQPSKTISLSARQRQILSEALYAGSSSGSSRKLYAADPVRLLSDMDQMAEELRQRQEAQLPTSGGHVLDWLPLAQKSMLKGGVWRDLAIKVATREGAFLEVSPVQSDGNRRSSAVQQMTEGTVLRLLYVLQMLYPLCLRRISDLRFRVDDKGGQYHHLRSSLDLLAFGPDRLCPGPGAGPSSSCKRTESLEGCPQISTELWPHQQEAVDRVMEGILAGKRGFADASSVGSGKTLTAIATIAETARWLESRGMTRHGALVMVPTNDLIEEWVQQAKLHTSGIKVVVQLASGQLHDRGTTGLPGGMVSGARGQKGVVDANTIVITSLARARDRPFTAQAGWDLVVIDECLSVQNDTAMQTMEAWRHVEASRCGVLMLSATFFRSRYTKLFYMVRMLRSALPRNEPFLNVTLCEHIICYIPKGRRAWRLEYNAVPLPVKAQRGYENRILDFVRAASASGRGRDHRVIWTELKAFLRFHFEEDILIDAFCSETARLQAAGRRPLLFANTDHEADLLLRRVPGARRLSQSRGSKEKRRLEVSAAKGGSQVEGPLVVTVHRGSHGLNLQGEADAIICRPQPGDIIEQMKGRVDRPGQVQSELHLVVLFAKDTVEEAEAANIRLCGAFFRQYLDPLSRTFQQLAVEASVTASSKTGGRVLKGGEKKGRCIGGVANAFRKQLQEVTAFKEEMGDGQEGVAAAAATAAGRTATPLKRSAEGLQTPIKDDPCTPPAATPGHARKKSKMDQATPSGQSSRKAGANQGSNTKSPRRPPLSINLGTYKEPKTDNEYKEQHAKRVKKAAEGGYDDGPARTLTSSEVDKALRHLRAADEKLGRVISQIGPPTGLVCRFGGDPFPAMAKSIIYQQLSTKAAASIFGRFEAACKGASTDETASVSPAAVLKLEVNTLRSCGLSSKKVEYVKLLAEEFRAGRLTSQHFAEASDAEVLALLCGCKGFGEWSANMFMMFNLGRADVLPVGDLAVRKAFKRLYGCRNNSEHDTVVADHVDLPDRQDMEEIAAAWKPYRTIGSWYMWHVVETAEAAYTYGGESA